MFFMMGITDGRKDFDLNQPIVCDICGKYGSFRLFMTYTVLSLFFIPCFKWNKHYYVRTTCCNTVYELNPEIAKHIINAEYVQIMPEHLRKVETGCLSYKKCNNCGYETAEDFEYCPKCGNRF